MKHEPVPLFLVAPTDPDYDNAAGFRVVEELPVVESRDFTATQVATEGLSRRAIHREYLLRTRANFIKNHSWVPYSEAELTLGNRGLDGKIGSVIGKSGDRILPAIENHVANANKFHGQALVDWVNISQALKTDESLDPSLNQLYANSDVRKVLVEYLFAKLNLDRLKWPPRKSKKQAYKTSPRELELAEIEIELDKLTDDDLIALWQETRESVHKRYLFWENETQEAKKSPNYDIVRAVGQ